MNGSGDSRSADASASRAFLERIRKALSHDLRTPLGTISNYAAILEYHGDSKPEDVRTFAGRIRASAVRTADMLQHITEAIALSDAGRDQVEVDTAALLRRKLSTMALYARFPAHGPEPDKRIVFDRDLLAFAWRAFLTVNSEAKPAVPLEIDIETSQSAEANTIDLWVGGKSPLETSGVGVAHFASELAREATPSPCFALGLAEELFRLHGGELCLWGSPVQSSSLRARLPRKA